MRQFMSKVVPGVVLVVCAWSGWAGAAVLRVDPNDPNAFATIGEAVAAAANNDIIVVAAGVYRGAGNRDIAPAAGKSLSLQSEGGAGQCIIDCEGQGSAFVLDANLPELVLDGFTLTGGTGLTGGAIRATGVGTLTLLNCLLADNHTTGPGGAVDVGVQGVRVVFSNCTFRDNTATYGGAVNIENSVVLLAEDCLFVGNQAQHDGGALWTLNVAGNFRRCAFYGNHADARGGAMYYSGTISLSNCTFSGNSAQSEGGAMYASGAWSTIMHCTFSRNRASISGGGWFAGHKDLLLDLYGGIFWGNEDQAGRGASAQICRARLEAVHSCIQNWPTIPTVISEDPQFVDPNGPDGLAGTADDDLSLRPGSPCIDTGFLTTASWPFDLDCSRRPRLAGKTIDLGAYEFHAQAVPPEPVGAWQSEPVVVSEVLAHSPATRDWVELQNVTDKVIDITGWQIEDQQQNLFTFGPGSSIEPHGYLVVYQRTDLPFGFEARGDWIVLRSAVQGLATGYAQSHTLRGTLADTTLVRHVNSVGRVDMVPSVAPTPGGANAPIVMSPVVITEIMYAPDGDTPAQYVEIANASAAPVALTDAGLSWRLGGYPSCSIPRASGVVLPPGGRLLFAADPNALVQRYPDIPLEVEIVGPWSGFLPRDAREVRLSLYAPNVPDGRVVEVDSVTYNTAYPLPQDDWAIYWSPTANGQGDSLHRRSLTAYGNDPNNWQAGPPTPGY
jgi:predicted outer membrane repeat protein